MEYTKQNETPHQEDELPLQENSDISESSKLSELKNWFIRYFGKPICVLITAIFPPLMIFLRFRKDGAFRAKYQILWSIGLFILTSAALIFLFYPSFTVVLFLTTWALSSLAAMAGSLIGYQIKHNQVIFAKKGWNAFSIFVSLGLTCTIAFFLFYLNLFPLSVSIAIVSLTLMIISSLCMAGFRYFGFKNISKSFASIRDLDSADETLEAQKKELHPFLRIKNGLLTEWRLMLGYEHAPFIFNLNEKSIKNLTESQTQNKQSSYKTSHKTPGISPHLYGDFDFPEQEAKILGKKELEIPKDDILLRPASPLDIKQSIRREEIPQLTKKEIDTRIGFFTASTPRIILMLLILTTLAFIILALPPVSAFLPALLPTQGFSLITSIAAILIGILTVLFYKMIDADEKQNYPQTIYVPLESSNRSYLFERVSGAYGRIYYEKIGIEILGSQDHHKIQIKKHPKKENHYIVLTFDSHNNFLSENTITEEALQTLPYSFAIEALGKNSDILLNAQNMMLDGTLTSLEIQTENFWNSCKRKFLEFCHLPTPLQKSAYIFLDDKGKLKVKIYNSSLSSQPAITYENTDIPEAKKYLIQYGFSSKEIQALDSFGRYRAHFLDFKADLSKVITIDLPTGNQASVCKDTKLTMTSTNYKTISKTISGTSSGTSKATQDGSPPTQKRTHSSKHFDSGSGSDSSFSSRIALQPPPKHKLSDETNPDDMRIDVEAEYSPPPTPTPNSLCKEGSFTYSDPDPCHTPGRRPSFNGDG